MTRKQFYPPRQDEPVDFTSHENLPWPKPGQRLFVPPPEGTPYGYDGSLHVHWAESFKSEDFVGSAFKDAGDQLTEAVLQGGDGSHPDRYFYPIAYLYRHATELGLKSLVRDCMVCEHFDEGAAIERKLLRHSLLDLWHVLRPGLEKAEPQGEREVLESVEGMISELDAVDPDGMRLRYASDRAGLPIKLGIPDVIDLEHLRASFDALWSFLEAAGAMLDHHKEWVREMKVETRSYKESWGP